MTKRLIILLASLVLVVPFLFYGCSGDDGAAGPRGATGDNGATGATGPVTNTDEACMVCHTTSRVADISDSATTTPTGAAGFGVHYNANYEKPNILVDNIILSNAGGLPKVTFRLRKATDNSAITSIPSGYPRFMIANLVPATPAAPKNGWSSDLWETWASERSDTVGGVWVASDNVNGNYSYTFLTPFDNAAVLSPDIDNTQIQRLVIRVSGGTVVNNAVGTTTNNAVAVADFNLPIADGANAVFLTYKARQFVTADACRKCHGPLLAGAAHGGSYADPADSTLICSLCHTPIGGFEGPGMVDTGAWAINFYHKIHSAIAMPSWTTRIGGKGYGAVTYPQDVRNCVTCHTASGKDLGLGNKIDNWKNNPTAAACGSCHEGFPLTSHLPGGTAHPGGNVADTTCSTCHPASGTGFGKSVTEAHDTTPTGMNVPEFNVTLTTSAPANGTHYVANENVLVTATLKKHSDNTAVAGTVYTSAKDNVAIAGGGLSVARVYVYGPRALPKPLLAAQATNMFVSTADNNVKTDATGFKYQVKIPSGLTSGTYMVRVIFADYSRVNDNNYVIDSTAFKTIQIGSATVTKKVSGEACVDCHGTGTAPFHDARHSVVFNTDECVSCHDYSGGHADVLANRVHAVHAASKTGDFVIGAATPIDWSDVTYPLGLGWPGGIGRCDICHTSGNTSYRTVTAAITCLGCHGDRPGAAAHLVQNGSDYPVIPDITP